MAVYSSEIFLPICHTTWCHNPEDTTLIITFFIILEEIRVRDFNNSNVNYYNEIVILYIMYDV
jgi:hypothetical protein